MQGAAKMTSQKVGEWCRATSRRDRPAATSSRGVLSISRGERRAAENEREGAESGFSRATWSKREKGKGKREK